MPISARLLSQALCTLSNAGCRSQHAEQMGPQHCALWRQAGGVWWVSHSYLLCSHCATAVTPQQKSPGAELSAAAVRADQDLLHLLRQLSTLQ